MVHLKEKSTATQDNCVIQMCVMTGEEHMSGSTGHLWSHWSVPVPMTQCIMYGQVSGLWEGGLHTTKDIIM